MNILLDTVILIDHFNGIEKATDFIKKNSPNIVLSVVTRAGEETALDVFYNFSFD